MTYTSDMTEQEFNKQLGLMEPWWGTPMHEMVRAHYNELDDIIHVLFFHNVIYMFDFVTFTMKYSFYDKTSDLHRVLTISADDCLYDHLTQLWEWLHPQTETDTTPVNTSESKPVDKTLTFLRCKMCGAPLHSNSHKCEYCGREYIFGG